MLKKMMMGLSLLRSKLTGHRFPFMINWAITGHCNLRCKHCYGEYGTVQKTELPLEVILKTIDELKKLGTRRITVEGGEPLFRKDIDEILRYIHSKGMEMSLCTNGFYLDKHIQTVKDTVDLVVLSLDGNEEHNDAVRGKTTYRRTLEALELARDNGLNTLIFSCLLDHNIDDLDFLVKLAVDHRTSITFNVVVGQINAEGKGERHQVENKAEQEKYREALRKILDYKRKGYPVFYSEKNYLQAINWPDFAKEKYYDDDIAQLAGTVHKSMIPCFAGKRFAYIESDGGVYPCYQKVGEMQVKSIADVSFREAFDYLDTIKYCRHCYNLTISELNLQSDLDPGSVWKVIKNYSFNKKG